MKLSRTERAIRTARELYQGDGRHRRLYVHSEAFGLFYWQGPEDGPVSPGWVHIFDTREDENDGE